MTSEIELKDLMAAIGSIQQTLQTIATKQEDDSLLLQSFTTKLEVQGQRLRCMEKELKEVKEVLTPDSIKQSVVGAEGDKAQQSDIITESKFYYLKEDITVSMERNTEQIQNLIKQELRQANDRHTQQANAMKNNIKQCIAESTKTVETSLRNCSRNTNDLNKQNKTDIISRLGKAEQLFFSPMAEMSSSISSIEHFEKGIRTIENSLNANSHTLSVIKEKITPKDQLTSLFKTFGQTSKHHHDFTNQDAINDYLVERIESLTETNSEQTSALEKIQKEFATKGEMDDILRKHSWALLNQVVSESLTLREIIKQERAVRRTYKCDFYIIDFNQLVNTGKRQYSQVWFIDGAEKYVKGCANFEQDGTVAMRIVHAFNPRVLGQKVEPGPDLKVTLKAVKIQGNNWEIFTRVLSTNELNVNPGADGWKTSHGSPLATICCRELQARGYVDKWGKLLFRYEITIL